MRVESYAKVRLRHPWSEMAADVQRGIALCAIGDLLGAGLLMRVNPAGAKFNGVIAQFIDYGLNYFRVRVIGADIVLSGSDEHCPADGYCREATYNGNPHFRQDVHGFQ